MEREKNYTRRVLHVKNLENFKNSESPTETRLAPKRMQRHIEANGTSKLTAHRGL